MSALTRSALGLLQTFQKLKSAVRFTRNNQRQAVLEKNLFFLDDKFREPLLMVSEGLYHRP